MIITIDGPALSGKSTVAKKLAQKLGFYYLYTGLLYRAVAYVLIEKFEIKPQRFSLLFPDDLGFINDLCYTCQAGEPKILFDGEDITAKLKDSSLDQLSSKISSNKYVRKLLLGIQHEIGKNYNIVADGRDCGSVVFPGADYKFFLTASLEVRAERKSRDEGIGRGEAMAELVERDERDRSREVAPLVVPSDAILVDNSDLTIEETIQKFLNYIKE